VGGFMHGCGLNETRWLVSEQYERLGKRWRSLSHRGSPCHGPTHRCHAMHQLLVHHGYCLLLLLPLLLLLLLLCCCWQCRCHCRLLLRQVGRRCYL
jgi:hypothetical protein